MGESRVQRIKEFHEENDTKVVGLREGSWLRIENTRVYLQGHTGAKIFIKGKNSLDFKTNSRLDFLLK